MSNVKLLHVRQIQYLSRKNSKYCPKLLLELKEFAVPDPSHALWIRTTQENEYISWLSNVELRHHLNPDQNILTLQPMTLLGRKSRFQTG